MIVGLVPMDAGTIYIDSDNISHLPMHGRARRGIGYLPQEASIFRKLSVEKNIMAILETRKDLDQKGREEKLEQLLQEFHITHIRKNTGMSLSGVNADVLRLHELSRQSLSLCCLMSPLLALTPFRSPTSKASLPT